MGMGHWRGGWGVGGALEGCAEELGPDLNGELKDSTRVELGQ